jgi:ankyrin repeat protein
MTVVDESSDADISSVCDPMSMLLDAKLENIAAFDATEAKRLQRAFEAEHELHKDFRMALAFQSEEDQTVLKSEALIENDFQLAAKAQEEEAQAIKLQEQKDLELASQAQEEEEREMNKMKNQVSQDTEIAKKLHDEFVSGVLTLVSKGDCVALKGLIDNGLDCSIVSSIAPRYSPLQMAVKSNQLDACKLLLASRAAVDYIDSAGDTALHIAAEGNKVAFIKVLLDGKATVDVKNKIGQTALTLTAKGGYSEAVDILLQAGAYIYHKDVHNKMPLQYVPFLSRSLKAKLEGMMGWALLEAARKGRGDKVMMLVDRGASVFLSDEHNRTALHHAAAGGHTLVVDFLLQRNADPNALDIERQSPLHKAAAGNAVHAFVTLQRYGARPTADSKGRCPSQLCCNPASYAQITAAEASGQATAAETSGAGSKAPSETDS